MPSDDYRVVFVGNPDSERIRYLRAISDLGLGLFGQWEWAKLGRGDPLLQCVRGGVQRGDAMVRAMRKARISLNVLRQSQKTAHNMRTFEIPACGVCCVSEHTIGVAEMMQTGQDIETFRTPTELREVVIRLLSSTQTIHALAASGHERVRTETYSKRAAEILQILG